MQVIIDFLTDSAKIVFGSAVVGFFIPSISGQITNVVFISGILATAVFLGLAVVLSKQASK